MSSALKASNLLFNQQLQKVLKPGTNITFDTNVESETTINCTGLNWDFTTKGLLIGDVDESVSVVQLDQFLKTDTPDILQISQTNNLNELKLNAATIKIYDENKIYPAANLVIGNGIVWSVDSNGFFMPTISIPSPFISKINFKSSNQNELIQCDLKSSWADLYLLPNGAGHAITTEDRDNVNGKTSKVAKFLQTATLSLPNEFSPLTINRPNDFTIMIALSVNQTPDQEILNFSGTDDIYPLKLKTSENNQMIFQIGPESHVFPAITNAPFTLIIRAYAVNSLLPMLTVFAAGTTVYHNMIGVFDLTIGIGGPVRFGGLANSSNLAFDLIDFKIFDTSLTDQECLYLNQTTSFLNKIPPTPIGPSQSASFDASSINASNGFIDDWASVVPDNTLDLVAQGGNITHAPANKYPIVFGNATGEAYLATSLLNGKYLTSPFATFMNMRVHNASPTNGDFCSLLTLAKNTTTVNVFIKTTLTAHIFKLKSSFDVNNEVTITLAKQNNSEFGLLLNIQVGVASLTIISYNSTKRSCSVSLATSEPFIPQSLTIGKRGTTSNIQYAVSHLFLHSSVVLNDDQATFLSTFTQANSLPTAGVLI